MTFLGQGGFGAISKEIINSISLQVTGKKASFLKTSTQNNRVLTIYYEQEDQERASKIAENVKIQLSLLEGLTIRIKSMSSKPLL